jgi:predicted tellurium resistance membrane protein TerC
MFANNWRPFVGAAVFVAVLTAASRLAEHLFGYNSFTVYWTLVFICFIGFALKWSYDWNKSAIEMEQKQMLRDIEKKHL